MDRLVDSSDKTRRWLETIRSRIEKKLPFVKYGEAKHEAFFKNKNPFKNRNFVYLHPQHDQIRLFTKLPLSFDNELKPTPATGNRRKECPSMFMITSKDAIEKAIFLIINSCRFDLLSIVTLEVWKSKRI